MAANAETVTTIRALLALSESLAAMRRALSKIAPEGNVEFSEEMNASYAATDEYLNHLQKLLDLIGSDGA